MNATTPNDSEALAALWRSLTRNRPRRSIRVKFANGDTLETWIRGTEEEIRAYYIGRQFDFAGHPDGPEVLTTATAVTFLD